MDDGNQLEGVTPEGSLTSTKEAEMARIDRENALVLVSEVLRHRGPEMAAIRAISRSRIYSREGE